MAEHNTLTDPELHEPKDVSTATVGQTYVADGAGSGAWFNQAGANTVVINSASDFPAPVAGVITLLTKTEYVISADVTTADRFVLSDRTTLRGQSTSGTQLTYTGTGTMFTGVDAQSQLFRMRIDCPNGKAFDMTDTVGGIKSFQFIESALVSAVDFGSFSNLSVLALQNSGTGLITNGPTVSGVDFGIISLINFSVLSTSATFIGFDFGTAISDRINITNFIVTAPAGAIGVKGAAGSANVPVGRVANITNSSFTGGLTTPLSGITPDDIRWRLESNSPNVQDTMPDALLSLTANATPTVLSVGVPTIVLGTFVSERASHFTNTTAGRTTYNGERDITTPIDISIVVDVASGTNKSIRAYVAINGTEVTNSGKAVNISSGDPKELTMPWQEVITTNDFVEVFIENETDSVNATVVDATIRVR